MSFKGRITKRIKTPFGVVTVVEHPSLPKKSKVVYWLGEMRMVLLGKLTTIYTAKERKSEFQPINWYPLCYEVTWNEEADPTEAIEYLVHPDLVEGVMKERKAEFDEEEEALKFCELLKCKDVKQGSVNISTRKEFSILKAAIDKVNEEECKQ